MKFMPLSEEAIKQLKECEPEDIIGNVIDNIEMTANYYDMQVNGPEALMRCAQKLSIAKELLAKQLNTP